MSVFLNQFLTLVVIFIVFSAGYSTRVRMCMCVVLQKLELFWPVRCIECECVRMVLRCSRSERICGTRAFVFVCVCAFASVGVLPL